MKSYPLFLSSLSVFLFLVAAVRQTQSSSEQLTFRRIDGDDPRLFTIRPDDDDSTGVTDTDDGEFGQDEINSNDPTAAPSTSVPSTSAPSTSAPSTNAPNTNAPSTNTQSTTSAGRHVFKVLQIADLHWGEAPTTDWGPEHDKKSASAIQTYLRTEQPDFVVLSGDQIHADFMLDNAKEKHAEIIGIMQDAMPNVKWCILMGNHDDHPFEVVNEDGKIKDEIDAQTSRNELLQFDSSFDGSFTQPGELSNYAVPLFLDDGTAAADIYVFDTGGGALSKKLGDEQIDWFNKITSEHSIRRPAVAFQHIPPRKGFEFKEGCVGIDSGEVRVIQNSPGILNAMENDGHTHFLAVGHNHGNDYCCSHDGTLHLCFGRHSGYGGYEEVSRGARVYQLELSVDETGKDRQFSWSSWVRLDTGERENVYQPAQTYNYLAPLTENSSSTRSMQPSSLPSQFPTSIPTITPTMSDEPTLIPSSEPSWEPTIAPSTSFDPTNIPTPIEPSIMDASSPKAVPTFVAPPSVFVNNEILDYLQTSSSVPRTASLKVASCTCFLLLGGTLMIFL